MKISQFCFFILLFIGLVLSQSSDQNILQSCVQGTVNNYCAYISSSDDCMSINGTFSIDGLNYYASTNISSISGNGEIQILCETTLSGSCTACWSVNNVAFVDEGVESCYRLDVTCQGLFTYHLSQDLGCGIATDCQEVLECPDDCYGNGHCNENGLCECYDGYFGENCSAYLDDGCITKIAENPLSMCVDPHFNSCDEIEVVISSESAEDSSWYIHPSTVLLITHSMDHDYQLSDECIAHLTLSDVVKDETGFNFCIHVNIDCISDSDYLLGCYTLGEDCTEDECYYSGQDETVPLNSGDLSINSGEWLYFTLQKDLRSPTADMNFNIELTSGTLNLFERNGCRPLESIYTHHEEMDQQYFTWSIIDDCNSAISSGIMQQANLYYFAFQCTSEDDCSFSFEFAVHTIETIYVNEPEQRVLWERTGYQYFQLFPGNDALEIQLHVTFSDSYNVAGSLYINSGECASKYDYVAYQLETSSNVVINHQRVLTYIVEIDPNDFGHSPIEITVYTTASCDGNTDCGYWEIAVFYQDNSASLPYGGHSTYESLTGLPSVSQSSYESETGLPYNPASSTSYESVTGLPSFSNPESSYYPDSTYTSYDTLGTPNISSNPDSSFDQSISNVETNSDLESSNESDSQDTLFTGDKSDSGDSPLLSTTMIIIIAILGVIVVVGAIIFLSGAGFIAYKYKKSNTTRFELGFDDDGLLLGDDDFEL